MTGWDEMQSGPKQGFKQKMLDPKNRRSTHIEDRRSERQLNNPNPLLSDPTTVSPDKTVLDRARSAMSVMTPYVPTRRPKKR